LNPRLFVELSKIDDPRLIAVNDTMDNLDKIMQKHGVDKMDHLVSAIPFMIMDNKIVIPYLNKYKDFIKKNGTFTQVHYAYKRRFYEKIFGNAKVHFVPANVPPAIVVESKIV